MSEITYIRTRSGWLYLAVVLDLYARKVVGWAMAPTMHAELVSGLLQQRAAALQTGQLATQCLRAAIGNQTTYRCFRKNLTSTFFFVELTA